MDRLVYLSMAGAKAAMQRQDVLAHNLANVGSNGFRAEMAAHRAVPVRGEGASTRAYALETTVGHSDAPGPVQTTGRNLDVALKGQAWLAVQGLDGTEAYTRAGSLDVNADGMLVTQAGLPVNGDGGPITVPAGAHVAVAADGTLTAQVGAGPQQAIGRLKLVTPTAETPLKRGDDGLFRSADGDLPADEAARLQDGALEGSNVSAVETMVQMIAAARHFESQMKLITSQEKQEQQASRLLSPS